VTISTPSTVEVDVVNASDERSISPRSKDGLEAYCQSSSSRKESRACGVILVLENLDDTLCNERNTIDLAVADLVGVPISSCTHDRSSDSTPSSSSVELATIQGCFSISLGLILSPGSSTRHLWMKSLASSETNAGTLKCLAVISE